MDLGMIKATPKHSEITPSLRPLELLAIDARERRSLLLAFLELTRSTKIPKTPFGRETESLSYGKNSLYFALSSTPQMYRETQTCKTSKSHCPQQYALSSLCCPVFQPLDMVDTEVRSAEPGY